jgi:hypothetical protein
MQKDQRVAALERMIQQYEKCRSDLLLLEQELRARASTEEMDDILALNAQMLESTSRLLHITYARLEREQSLSVARRLSVTPAFTPLRLAMRA